jgi:L-ascorbate 6-phosphate lactonase
MDDFATKVLNAAQEETHLFSVGQAGYIIKSKRGQLLGIDLYLSECVEIVEGHIGFKRLLPKILGPFDLKFNSIVTTHPHYDHFDIDSIPELLSTKKTKLYASVNCEYEVRRLKITNDNITYVKPGEVYTDGDFELEFVSCDHGTGAPDAVGIVIKVDDKKIYIAGDTCLRLDRVEEYASKGPFDVMIAPINGAYGNLNENECAILSNALKPMLTIPCHYGMFASHGGNPGKFIDIMNKEYPNNKYLLLALGEGLTLK